MTSPSHSVSSSPDAGGTRQVTSPPVALGTLFCGWGWCPERLPYGHQLGPRAQRQRARGRPFHSSRVSVGGRRLQHPLPTPAHAGPRRSTPPASSPLNARHAFPARLSLPGSAGPEGFLRLPDLCGQLLAFACTTVGRRSGRGARGPRRGWGGGAICRPADPAHPRRPPHSSVWFTCDSRLRTNPIGQFGPGRSLPSEFPTQCRSPKSLF